MKTISYSRSVTDTASLFCRQFIAGPVAVAGLPGWVHLDVSDSLILTAHPELEVQQVKQGICSITLLGHLLDTDEPQSTNREILDTLLSRFSDIAALIEACAIYGGRWLIIAVRGNDGYVITDALGLRQVFYTDSMQFGSTWLMSQPGLAMALFGLELEGIHRSFAESPEFRSYPEYSWPAFGTPFAQLERLLPNHYLHLNTCRRVRYWPAHSVMPVTFDGAIEEVSRRMENSVAAVVNRFEHVVLGITAGLDSRMVLAAARKYRDRIGYVTVQQCSMTDGHQDIVVPRALLEKLTLPHSVVHAKQSRSSEFGTLFKENVFMAHEHYGRDAEALWNKYNRASVALTGSGAEVGRCSYRWAEDNSAITAETLAVMGHKAGSLYAIDRYGEWLATTGDTHGVNILDLYSWENAHGTWLAMTQLEFDIAWREILTPYNCRRILTTMLGVPEKDRRRPHFKLAKAITRNLWPEVLSEPINPAGTPPEGVIASVKRRLRKAMAAFR